MSKTFLTIDQLESMSKEALQAEYKNVFGTEAPAGTKPKLIEAIQAKYEELKKEDEGKNGNGSENGNQPPITQKSSPVLTGDQARFLEKLKPGPGEIQIERELDGKLEIQKTTQAAWEMMTNKHGWRLHTPNELKS